VGDLSGKLGYVINSGNLGIAFKNTQNGWSKRQRKDIRKLTILTCGKGRKTCWSPDDKIVVVNMPRSYR
jgi:hypothetical protein